MRDDSPPHPQTYRSWRRKETVTLRRFPNIVNALVTITAGFSRHLLTASRIHPRSTSAITGPALLTPRWLSASIMTAMTAADHPIDLDHLKRQTFGDADLEREVLDLFVRQSRLMVARMQSARDAASWAEAIHTLKGSALGIGAFAVALAAEAAEVNTSGGGPVEAIAAEVERANAFILGRQAA
jgi:HPt (histidine-containing phosphotransfer) domain-containing protein